PALDHHVLRLAHDHAAAHTFAEAVAGCVPTAVDPNAVETNIVVIDTGRIPAAPIAAAAAERGGEVSALGPFMIRAVTHLDVTADDCEWAGPLVGKPVAEEGSPAPSLGGSAASPYGWDMRITHLGHAAVLAETDGARILIDPGNVSDAWHSLTDLGAGG